LSCQVDIRVTGLQASGRVLIRTGPNGESSLGLGQIEETAEGQLEITGCNGLLSGSVAALVSQLARGTIESSIVAALESIQSPLSCDALAP
jgi:hypothetical protein